MQTFKKNKEYIFEIIHDIKAPIMSMDYALKTIPKNEILEEIYKINKHNLNYIENLLTTHLIEKGKYCPKFELINLIQITEEELRVLNFLITEKKLRINLSIDKINDGYIASDKNLIKQIILNLLTNAIKYSPKNSLIKIIFEKINNKIVICFSNNYDNNIKPNSSKMGLNIIKSKLKVLKGKLKITKKDNEICYSVYLNC